MLTITDSSDAARLLREARLDAGFTQRAFADRAGVKQSHIAAIESGKRAVSPEKLTQLLRLADYRPSVPLEREADTILALARDRGLGNVRVFGSTVRGQDGFDSDADLLVTIERNVPFGLASFASHVEDLLLFPTDVVVDDDSEFAATVRAEAIPL